jgi:biopolymer transport protein TolR
MAHIKSSDDTSFLSEINMVPMIDVALVLLIIFMVITPQMILNSIQVRLPKSTSEKTPPAKVLSIAIQPDGRVYLNNEFVAPDALTDKIRLLSPATLEGALIFSDKNVPVSDVVDVIDRVEAAGVHNINLTTERKSTSVEP